MARKGGVDRGITQRKGRKGWWVRLYMDGRERWFRCDTKSQAKALYGRLKAEIRQRTTGGWWRSQSRHAYGGKSNFSSDGTRSTLRPDS